ncbi:hypothetical protein [uncultured Paraglaciecola sp.]|uniref:hypothetical protein n=1 Tax=uncultured Paraglaciecola sp. TaxID=1765024 RepID=UPI0030DDC4F3|tara:strand:- start:41472 stop:42341 length:870 start_codon:yes stop_codon:yes gene_type:complete
MSVNKLNVNLIFLLLSQVVVFPSQHNIKLEVLGHTSEAPNWSFFAPHENENVVNDYVSQQILERGGVFVILRQKGKRLLRLDIKPFEVKIDPNRIFTKKGRRNNIIKHNPRLRTNTYVFHRAMRLSEALANFIVKTMGGTDTSRTWVAIHNNTHGYLGDNKQGIGNISIVQYQQKLAEGAAFIKAVSLHKGDEDDLFFVTEQQDFNAMDQNGWNAVLQHPQVVTDPTEDDGSLSVYAQKLGIRYINIEAERATGNFGENHLEEQQQMVDYVFRRLLSKNTDVNLSNSLD